MHEEMKNGLAVFCSIKLGKWSCLGHTVELPMMGAIPKESWLQGQHVRVPAHCYFHPFQDVWGLIN